MAHKIYTIGHSNHLLDHFLSLLQRHAATAVCDVRSQPQSRHNPHFNREPLANSLRYVGITYVFLGKELGARSDDPACWRDGMVQYDLLARSKSFLSGIERIKRDCNRYVIALMCAEKEPNDCHRSILVGRTLSEIGFEVKHILANGEIELHTDSIDRLAKTLKLPTGGMLPDTDLAERAYAMQSKKIAYSKPTQHFASNYKQRVI